MDPELKCQRECNYTLESKCTYRYKDKQHLQKTYKSIIKIVTSKWPSFSQVASQVYDISNVASPIWMLCTSTSKFTNEPYICQYTNYLASTKNHPWNEERQVKTLLLRFKHFNVQRINFQFIWLGKQKICTWRSKRFFFINLIIFLGNFRTNFYKYSKHTTTLQKVLFL